LTKIREEVDRLETEMKKLGGLTLSTQRVSRGGGGGQITTRAPTHQVQGYRQQRGGDQITTHAPAGSI